MATEANSLRTPQAKKFSIPAKPSSSQPSCISKVRVIVRVRPFLPHEISPSPIPCASVIDTPFESSEEVTVHLKDQGTSRNECYKLDSFYAQEDNNVSQIFTNEVSHLIPGLFCGCNATVFAYGATGSGKTYTMQGGNELPGLVHLAMSNILSMCESTGSVAEMSYYEVYMDRCYDLLEPKAKEIAVLDDNDGQIHLKGLARVSINSMPEFHEAFSSAIQRRKVAHTGINDVSSRSHGVLVVCVSTPCDDSSGNVVMGKLNLIDLAGNEDNRRTCNVGIRLQESAKINQSLFALSNVIYALNNNRSRVPYRESKLTRILQDSLGGRSRALMVACLNPGEYQESVYTVSLAARSRHISNFVSSAQKQETPKVKVDMEAKLRSWLESKGKSRSGQKIGAFGSPFLGRTPSSASCIKKPFISRTPSSASCIKKPDMSRSSAKPKTFNNLRASNLKERTLPVPQENLSYNGGLIDSVMESSDLVTEKNTGPEFKDPSDRILVESNACTPERQPLETVDNTTSIKYPNFIGSSPTSGKLEALRNSIRKVLSPICSNINIGNMSSKDQICVILFDPNTPKPQHVLNYPNDKFQEIGTPLGKFNSQSSNLKSYLVQEYLDFLNTANKEELLELKGIGQKMAEYILELREISPIKSLNDLEKIGLSSKQANKMFGRAAKGLFD